MLKIYVVFLKEIESPYRRLPFLLLLPRDIKSIHPFSPAVYRDHPRGKEIEIVHPYVFINDTGSRRKGRRGDVLGISVIENVELSLK